MSNLSDSFTVAHLSWVIWANCSQSLIWFERNGQMSKWEMSEWANSQPCFFVTPLCTGIIQNNVLYLGEISGGHEIICKTNSDCLPFWTLLNLVSLVKENNDKGNKLAILCTLFSIIVSFELPLSVAQYFSSLLFTNGICNWELGWSDLALFAIFETGTLLSVYF